MSANRHRGPGPNAHFSVFYLYISSFTKKMKPKLIIRKKGKNMLFLLCDALHWLLLHRGLQRTPTPTINKIKRTRKRRTGKDIEFGCDAALSGAAVCAPPWRSTHERMTWSEIGLKGSAFHKGDYRRDAFLGWISSPKPTSIIADCQSFVTAKRHYFRFN